jgi:flagellar motility protein MotE (MotC chaperone)
MTMAAFRRRPRLLPVLIVAATVALAGKFGSLVPVMSDAAYSAAASVPAASGVRASTSPAAIVPLRTAAEGAAPAAGAADAVVPDAGSASPAERLQLSEAEVDVLQKLSERRQALDAREQGFAERQALLAAAEGRIDQKIGELKDLRTTLEHLVKAYDDQEESKLKSLVRIYENMKPKDAARIFEELEMETLLLVAERMNERKLAPVMADMNAAKAKLVTVELARRRRLPPAGSPAG